MTQKEYLENLEAILVDYKKDLRRYTKLAESYAKKRDSQIERVAKREQEVKELKEKLNKEAAAKTADQGVR